MASKLSYVFSPDRKGLLFVNGDKEEMLIPLSVVKDGLLKTNAKIETISTTVPGLFHTLGLRNLSAFVGEVFVEALAEASHGLLIRNPHQDGYPDLLAMTPRGKKAWAESGKSGDKNPFSPFVTGGIEVKSTCGSVPTPTQLARKGLQKPQMGDSRIEVVTGYDWKAHHRLTNNLLANVWDFVEGKPLIVAVFYGEKLTEDDWGAIVQPREGGGRTTSVSIMSRAGVKKMYDGWVAVVNDPRYASFFDRFNGSDSMTVALQDPEPPR